MLPVTMNIRGSAASCHTEAAKSFLAEPKFHLLTHVAVGARVLLTHNVTLKKGAANGVPATVEEIIYGDGPATHIVSFRVRIVATGVVQPVSRTIFRRTFTSEGV